MNSYTPVEQGILLLCSDLCDASEKPLTGAQYRRLCLRVAASAQPDQRLEEDVVPADLLALGCSAAEANHIVRLLNRRAQLAGFLRMLEQRGITALTRLSPGYPVRLLQKLGVHAPLVLFGAGDLTLLNRPAIAVVGSRKLRNVDIAQAAGRWVASQGYVLCSGGAAGADTAAAESCLAQRGNALLYLPGQLETQMRQRREELEAGQLALLSAGSPWAGFRPERALERNRWIHAHGQAVVVCQCDYGRGGTWKGSMENLKAQWSPVYVADDGSEGANGLMERGARRLDWDALAAMQNAKIP